LISGFLNTTKKAPLDFFQAGLFYLINLSEQGKVERQLFDEAWKSLSATSTSHTARNSGAA
jgi:hypothetical protein